MKKLFKTFVALAAVAALGFSFVSCKNNDDDNGSGSPSSGGGNGAATGNNGSGKSQSGNSGYIGTKAPSEAKAVGDIVFNDGSATPYTNARYLSYEKKQAAVAVIFYAGSSADVLGAKTLGVGLNEIGGAFASIGTTGYTTNFTEIQCTPDNCDEEGQGGDAGTAKFTGDLDGSDNWAKICATDKTAEENAETNYPLFYKINNYGTEYNLTGDYQSGWYVPTVAELSMLHRVRDTVNAAFPYVGRGGYLLTGYYISSSQCSGLVECVFVVNLKSGYIGHEEKKSRYNFYCRPIRAF